MIGVKAILRYLGEGIRKSVGCVVSFVRERALLNGCRGCSLLPFLRNVNQAELTRSTNDTFRMNLLCDDSFFNSMCLQQFRFSQLILPFTRRPMPVQNILSRTEV